MRKEKDILIEIDKLCEKFEDLSRLLVDKETYFNNFKKTIRHDLSTISFGGEIRRKLESEIYNLEQERETVHTQIKTLVWVLGR